MPEIFPETKRIFDGVKGSKPVSPYYNDPYSGNSSYSSFPLEQFCTYSGSLIPVFRWLRMDNQQPLKLDRKAFNELSYKFGWLSLNKNVHKAYEGKLTIDSSGNITAKDEIVTDTGPIPIKTFIGTHKLSTPISVSNNSLSLQILQSERMEENWVSFFKNIQLKINGINVLSWSPKTLKLTGGSPKLIFNFYSYKNGSTDQDQADIVESFIMRFSYGPGKGSSEPMPSKIGGWGYATFDENRMYKDTEFVEDTTVPWNSTTYIGCKDFDLDLNAMAIKNMDYIDKNFGKDYDTSGKGSRNLIISSAYDLKLGEKKDVDDVKKYFTVMRENKYSPSYDTSMTFTCKCDTAFLGHTNTSKIDFVDVIIVI